jgi:hypothetical protein
MRTCLGLFALTVLPGLSLARADDPIRLQEPLPAGHLYHVSCRTELNGSLTIPAETGQVKNKTLSVIGNSAIEYDERVLAVDRAGGVEKTCRIYRRMDFDRQIGDDRQQGTIRKAVRRLVLMRLKQNEVPFSPDGPLTWNEIDLVRTDVFTPALTGLLPTQAVRPGERWTASAAAVQELTDLEQIEEGQVECRLDQLSTLNGRRHARVILTGTVRGTNEDGPNRQQLNGCYFFDLESNHLSYLYLNGIHSLLDKDGKEMGKVEGKFVLTRQVNPICPDLGDASLRGLVVEPNADNTQLLYESPALGVRLLYPRRWRMAGGRGRQLALDETSGHGLLITLEPLNQLPTANQFVLEARGWLEQQKPAGSVKVVRVDPPQRLTGMAYPAEQFGFEVDISGQKVYMIYFIVRQQLAGATVAARLLPTDRAAVQQEVERIVRGLTLSKAVEIKAETPAGKTR